MGVVLKERYRIERVLGEGGMGTVFLATHLGLERPVAVKELLPAGSGFTPQIVRQFRTEARMLHDLSHPGLPRVYDFLEDDGHYYLVMDYIQGRTLYDVLLTDGEIQEHVALEWARQLAEVLHYLHTRRPPIIFRDLKPSNVMLSDNGVIKLIDFGIAKFLDANASIRTQTGARGVLSPGYAAPEQYGGHTDAASDTYAFGATLYCILTHEIPPDSVDLASGRAILTRVREIRPDVSERTADAIEAMMEVNRERRLLSIAGAMDALGLSPSGAIELNSTLDTAKAVSGLDNETARRAGRTPAPPNPRTDRWDPLREEAAARHPYNRTATEDVPNGRGYNRRTNVMPSAAPHGWLGFITLPRLGAAALALAVVVGCAFAIRSSTSSATPDKPRPARTISVPARPKNVNGKRASTGIKTSPTPAVSLSGNTAPHGQTPPKATPARATPPNATPGNATPPKATPGNATPPKATPPLVHANTPETARVAYQSAGESKPTEHDTMPTPLNDPKPAPSEAPDEGAGAADNLRQNRLIVEGERVGVVRLQDPVDKYTDRYPDFRRIKYRGKLYLVFDKLCLAVMPVNGYVARIIVAPRYGYKPRRYHTLKGNCVRVPKASIISEFGDDFNETSFIGGNGETLTQINYPRMGIGFVLTDEDLVRDIIVFSKPASSD